MEKLPNIRPGEILKEEFLSPLNITAYPLAAETNIPQTRISEIIKGKKGSQLTPLCVSVFSLVIRQSSGSVCKMIMILKIN